MQGLVAYGLYKVAKREWAAQIWETHLRSPTDDELRAYILTWTPSRLEGLRQQAEGALASFGADVIQAETPAIREEALRGTTGPAIVSAIYGNAVYTIILTAFVLILSWAGVDLLGLLEKTKPPKSSPIPCPGTDQQQGRRRSIMPSDFHEVRFPLDVSLRGSGGPRRLTEIVTLASGREHRNSRWADSRRSYDAGFGIRDVDTLHAVLSFFEERRGRLYGFRYRDRIDHRSGPPTRAVAPTDQVVGTGDGTTAVFALAKTYGTGPTPYRRAIVKPVAGSVRVAVNGTEVPDARVTCDATTGLLTFAASAIPAAGALVSAGFAFDVPVRFDTDDLTIDLAAFTAGEIPKVPLVEIVP